MDREPGTSRMSVITSYAVERYIRYGQVREKPRHRSGSDEEGPADRSIREALAVG
jgi:hypothetical protein